MRTLILLLSLSQSQTDTVIPAPEPVPQKMVYRVTVQKLDLSSQSGYLTWIDDSTIYISPTKSVFGSKLGYQVSYLESSIVIARRKNRVVRGGLIGLLTGVAVGVISGFVEGDDPHVPADQDFFGIGEAFRWSASQKALFYGASGGLVGGLVGAFIGALTKKKFTIGGKKDRHEKMLNTINQLVN